MVKNEFPYAAAPLGSLKAQLTLKSTATNHFRRLTNTVLATGVRLVAGVADATVASPQVLADAVLADVRVQGALIDIWETSYFIQMMLKIF